MNESEVMNPKGYLQTGQVTCHDQTGRAIECIGSGQDAAFRKGIPWPSPRFSANDDIVSDNLTGLIWTQNANPAGFPLNWQEAFDYIASLNNEKAFGYSDWRLPNRRELRSLMSHQTRKPALPEGHPFHNVFLGWYWTSTTAAINTQYAWYIHLEGARMFYGRKEQFYLVWPCRGQSSPVLPATGQTFCYDRNGAVIPCRGTGQDGEFRFGLKWPEPRFQSFQDVVIDHLTNLCWLKNSDLTSRLVTWQEALEAIELLNQRSEGKTLWRLPNINELESLVDCSRHSPALPSGHPFQNVQEGYWSSTTSSFEPDWAFALYLNKGAIGVGQKSGMNFSVWAVCDAEEIDETYSAHRFLQF